MAQVFFYRYVGPQEANDIAQRHVIKSGSGITWFTPNRYDAAATAQRDLALQAIPTHRVGPIPADELPDLDATSLRPVAPAFGFPGGGVEGATTVETHLFGIMGLATGSHLPLHGPTGTSP